MNQPDECPLCCNSYSTKGTLEPKVLPCGHTFCANCIQEIKPAPKKRGESGKCPNCNKSFDTYTTNYTVISLMDSLSNYKRTKSSKCNDEQGQPLKKYKTSELSIEEVRKDLELRESDKAQGELVGIKDRISVVVASINKEIQEKTSIAKNIAQAEATIVKAEKTIKNLKEKGINKNKILQSLRNEKTTLESEKAKRILLIKKHSGNSSNGK